MTLAEIYSLRLPRNNTYDDHNTRLNPSPVTDYHSLIFRTSRYLRRRIERVPLSSSSNAICSLVFHSSASVASVQPYSFSGPFVHLSLKLPFALSNGTSTEIATALSRCAARLCSATMGKQQTTISAGSFLRQALLNAVSGDRRLLTFPEQSFYRLAIVGCNLEIAIRPMAILFPKTVEHIQGIVGCAKEFGLHIQARSGGHSYGNYSEYHVVFLSQQLMFPQV